MPVFDYQALDARGRVVQGQIEAPNVEAVIEELRSVHYTVTDVQQRADHFAYINNLILKYQWVSLYALAIFTRQFATVFNSGIPIIRGLKGLAGQSLSRKLSMIIAQIYDDVRTGHTLTSAIQKHPTVFSPVYVALIRAGEMAGALGEILERLSDLLEKDFALRKKIQTSMTYPIIVFITAIIVVFILVLFIFPQFVGLLEGLDLELPWTTMLLIHTTNAFRNPVIVLLLIIMSIIFIIIVRQYYSTPVGHRQFDKFKIEAPLLGKINLKASISRFCRTLGTLLASGVPMVHALDIVAKVSGNEIIADTIDEINKCLRGGMRLSTPMRNYKLFPPMVSHMIAVGEETGNLPSILEKLATFYDTEVETALDSFVALVEPLMVFFLGGIVMLVMAAVFQPIYGILQRF